MVQQAVDTYGRLDILVNNAGIVRDRAIWNMTAADFDLVMNVHVRGTWLTCRAAAKHWRDRSEGRRGRRPGSHHQHHVGRRAARQLRPDQLRHGQGGDRRPHPDAQPRAGQARRDGQRDRAGRDHPDLGDDVGRRRARARRDPRRRVRSEGPVALLSRRGMAGQRRSGHVSGQVIRAMGEKIHLMGGWTEDVTISNGGRRWDAEKLGDDLRRRRVQDSCPRTAYGRLIRAEHGRGADRRAASPSGSTPRSARSSTSWSTPTRIPRTLIEQMKQMGVYGLVDPRAVWRLRRLRPLLRPRHRGDRPRLDVARRRVRRPLRRVQADPPLRHRGAAAAVPAGDGDRGAARHDGAHRARRWVRPPGDAHRRRPGRWRLRDQRLQDVDHQRPHVRAGGPALQDRSLHATPAHKGISILLVEKVPGFTVSRDLPKLGYKGVESCELHFDDCRVPAGALLGGVEGNGFAQMMTGLETGRIQVAGRAIGVARAAFDDALRYAQDRRAFGVPIWQHQAVGNLLADMATQITAGQQLNYHAADCIDSGRRADMEAGMAKLFCSEMAAKVALDAIRDPRRPRLLHRVRRRALLPRRTADDRRRRHQRSPPQRHRQADHRPQRARLDDHFQGY